LNTAQQNILKVLAYFDVFNYPLTAVEINSFLLAPVDYLHFNQQLELLITEKIIFKSGDFYSLKKDHLLVERRCKGNEFAKKQMITAAKAASILSHFPYVRALAISGSLSKNYSDEKADVDFFIITAPNRLWIARTIMHLFKKLSFLAGKENWFCMNYYIDESMMEIPEKNIFTAMEIVTMIPMYGHETFPAFYTNNQWTKDYFPGKEVINCKSLESKKGFFARSVEKIFNGKTGNAIDNWLMNLTDKRWKRKTEAHRVNMRGITMTLNVDKHFSKPDPRNFQSKVVQQYENKLKLLIAVDVN
jgi:hypothetical protein